MIECPVHNPRSRLSGAQGIGFDRGHLLGDGALLRHSRCHLPFSSCRLVKLYRDDARMRWIGSQLALSVGRRRARGDQFCKLIYNSLSVSYVDKFARA